MMRKLTVGIVFGFWSMVLLVGPPDAHAARNRDKLDRRIRQSADYFEAVMLSRRAQVPPALLRKASGIIIMRQFKAGFIVGLKGGGGIAMVRDELTRRWSAPAFVTAGEGSWGPQAGGQVVDSVILIMNEEGMRVLTQPKVRIGIDAAAVAGPHGENADLKFGTLPPIIVYSDSGGLYAGASFEGGFFAPDKKANSAYYGDASITMREILFGDAVSRPASGRLLINLIARYSRE